MATCHWDGCTVDVPVSVYKNGTKYQPKHCGEHAIAAKSRAAHRRSPEVGAQKLDSHGYTLVFTPNGWVPEHRLVMEKHLGRPLQKGEEVWHKNGDRGDNLLGNLDLRVGFGTSLAALTCPHCGEPYSAPSERSQSSLEATV